MLQFLPLTSESDVHLGWFVVEQHIVKGCHGVEQDAIDLGGEEANQVGDPTTVVEHQEALSVCRSGKRERECQLKVSSAIPYNNRNGLQLSPSPQKILTGLADQEMADYQLSQRKCTTLIILMLLSKTD